MYRMDSGIHISTFDSLKQQTSFNGSKIIKPVSSQDDFKTSKSDKEDTLFDTLAFLSENALPPASNSNSGAAKVELPSIQLASSANLYSSGAKHNFNSPETIKQTPTSHSLDNFGEALKNPKFFEKYNTQKPSVLDERKSSKVHGHSCKTSPKEQRIKVNRWRKFEGLFNGKKREPEYVSTEIQYHGRTKPLISSKQAQSSMLENQEAKEKGGNGPANTCIKTPSKIANSKKEASQRSNVSPSKIDDQLLKGSSNGVINSLLDVEIPDVKMDRYSVMFSGLLQNSPSNARAFHERRPANIERLKNLYEELAVKERELDEKSKILQQIATSPDLKPELNAISFSRETRSPELEPCNQGIYPYSNHSKEFSTFLLSTCSLLEVEASNKTESQRPESTSRKDLYENTGINKRFSFELPEVPQGFKLGLTNEQYLEFGFSNFPIEDENKDISSPLAVKQSEFSDIKLRSCNQEYESSFFSSNSSLDSLPSTSTSNTSMILPLDVLSSAVKESESLDIQSEIWNQGNEPSLYSSNSSLDSSSSSPVSNKSSIIPLSISLMTDHFKENRLKPSPQYDTVLPSCIPMASVITTCTANPPVQYQNSGKYAYSSRVPRALKKASSFSKRSELDKASTKTSNNDQQIKTKLSCPAVLSPSSNLKMPSTVKIASKAVSSPLDAIVLATNKELAHIINPSKTVAKELPLRGDGPFPEPHKTKNRVMLGTKPRHPNLVTVDAEDVQMQETKPQHLLQPCNKILEESKYSDSYNTGVKNNIGPLNHSIIPNTQRVLAHQNRKSHHVVVERISFADF